MTFDLDRINESKRAYRLRLAALPIAEKLRMLDELQDRELTIRAARRSMTDGKVTGRADEREQAT